MQFNTDKPIQNSTEDLLGRKSFSKTLSEAINQYKGTDSLVIGLFGKWGVGKTSIVNMVLENLNDKIIVNFSPWNYDSHSDLINLFFIELRKSIIDNGNVRDEKSLKEAFFEYQRYNKCTPAKVCRSAFRRFMEPSIFGRNPGTTKKRIRGN